MWRGERPQKGRFREFVQCDADIVGTTDVAADAEVITMLHAALDACGIGEFVIRINDRRILTGLIESLGVGADAGSVMRAIDKREKIGDDGVLAELDAIGVPADAAAQLLSYLGDESLERLTEAVPGNAGLASLRTVRELLDVPAGRVRVDPSIARGLDYYTGTVFETTYVAAPEIGSIMSGGRYDDLASLYSKTSFPGVGGSIGIDRILAAVLTSEARSGIVIGSLTGVTHRVVELAGELRRAGHDVDVFVGEKQTPRHQRQYAERRGARLAVTIDFEKGTAVIVDFATRTEETVQHDAVLTAVQRLLA